MCHSSDMGLGSGTLYVSRSSGMGLGSGTLYVSRSSDMGLGSGTLYVCATVVTWDLGLGPCMYVPQ